MKYSWSNFLTNFLKPQSYKKIRLSYISSPNETCNEFDSEFSNKFIDKDKSIIVIYEKLVIHDVKDVDKLIIKKLVTIQ